MFYHFGVEFVWCRIGKEDILFKKGSAVLIDYNLKDFFSEDEDEQIVFSKDDFFENIPVFCFNLLPIENPR